LVAHPGGESYWGKLLVLFVWAPLIAAFVVHGSSIVGFILAFIGSFVQNVEYAWIYALAPMSGFLFAIAVVISLWINPVAYLVAFFGIVPIGFMLGVINLFWLVGVAIAVHIYAIGFLLPFGVMYMKKHRDVADIMFNRFRREFIIAYFALIIVSANSTLDTTTSYGVSTVCIAIILMVVKFLAPSIPIAVAIPIGVKQYKDQ